jgi:hypothetical protein
MALIGTQNYTSLIYNAEHLHSCTEANLSVNDLEKKGFPKATLEALKTGYALALENYKKDPVSADLCLITEKNFKEVFQAFEQLPTILRKGHRVQKDGQWKKSSPEEYLPHLIDQFCCLETTLIPRYPKEHPFTKLSRETTHLLVSLYCKKQNLESSTFLSIPFIDKSYKGFLICIRDKDFWSVCIRDGENKHSFVETSKNRGFLLDESSQPIDSLCLSAIFHHNSLDKNTEKMFVRGLESANKAPTNPNQLSVHFQFTYYLGRPQSSDLPNAWTYTAILQSDGNYRLFSPEGIELCKSSRAAEEYVSAFLDSTKEEVINQFKKDITTRSSYLCYLPNSELELKMAERQILEEISKNPEEHADVIQLLLDHTTLPIIEDSPQEEEVSAKVGIEILLEAHPPVEIPSKNAGIDSSLVQKDAERRQQIEKTIKPPKKYKKGKGKPSEKISAAKTKPATSIPLTAEERSDIRQVRQGHSMKRDPFIKLGLTLLKRKAELKGEKLNERQAGSHVNAARLTLVWIHRNGRKDLQGMASHQKSFLHEVLSPIDN